MQVLNVADGATIDYSKVNTASLNKHLDKYTQIKFASWDSTPKTATKDMTIQALSEIGYIELTAMPEKQYYYSKSGNIDLTGLDVQITLIEQLPQYDDNGNRKVKKTIQDISASCYVKPSNLKNAFADGDSAKIEIYPLDSDLSIGDYRIYCLSNLGDVLRDGNIDATDASLILTYYAKTSIGAKTDFTDEQIKNADVDRNGTINSLDASYVLTYYALNATKQNPTWDTLLNH
jgi:hypothetical protein